MGRKCGKLSRSGKIKKSANNRVNLTAGSSAALRGKVIGAVRLPEVLAVPV
jgi:hypothetical protein